ncbi:MAG: polyprenyl synthetase family protein [Candidatus Omnitrophota bacterium]|jgi:geranylgeranyl diphosphate synthase type II
MKTADYLKVRGKAIDAALDACLPQENEYPKEIHRAMRYSVFSGGKRVRPILVLASCEACGGSIKDAMPAACAIELMHTYSLVHDDLPAMDDDDYRRGKPTCHKKFGEGVAVLAGDALLTFAFGLMAKGRDPKVNNEIIRTAAEAIGTYGMIGGQVVDIKNQADPDLPTLTYINARKTGSLIAGSCRIGAIAARASRKQAEALTRYGEYIGFTFQVIDDILDKEGFALALGVDGAKKEAARLIKKAHRELEIFGRRAKPLGDLAGFILNRKK